MMSAPKIFLSHAVRDKKLADAMRDLLVMGLNLRQSDIFYSSSLAAGIPIGADFNLYMQNQLKGAKLVVSLVTQGFYESAYCMCELGYQQSIHELDVYPIVFPPIPTSELGELVPDHELHSINNPKCLSGLADMAQKHISEFSMSGWHESHQRFKSEYQDIKHEIRRVRKVPISKWDGWALLRSQISVELLQHSGKLGHLFSEKGYGRYSFQNNRVLYGKDDGSVFAIDYCTDGKIHISPSSKNITIHNKPGTLKSVITIMAPPLGVEPDPKPEPIPGEYWANHEFIEWSPGLDIESLVTSAVIKLLAKED